MFAVGGLPKKDEGCSHLVGRKYTPTCFGSSAKSVPKFDKDTRRAPRGGNSSEPRQRGHGSRVVGWSKVGWFFWSSLIDLRMPPRCECTHAAHRIRPLRIVRALASEHERLHAHRIGMLRLFYTILVLKRPKFLNRILSFSFLFHFNQSLFLAWLFERGIYIWTMRSLNGLRVKVRLGCIKIWESF